MLNREIRIDGRPHTVVGVTAPGFTLPGEPTQLWLPLHLDRTAPAANYHWVRIYGLLRPGTTAEAASAELDRYMHELPAHFPNAYSESFFRGTGFYPRVVSVRTELLGSIDRTLWILLGSVLLVLLIAAGNVANLFLVRSESRRRETALRSSLGAERVHLALQYITEALLLSLAAAALGLLLAWGATRLLGALAPAGLPKGNATMPPTCSTPGRARASCRTATARPGTGSSASPRTCAATATTSRPSRRSTTRRRRWTSRARGGR